MTTRNHSTVDESKLLSLHPAPANSITTALPLVADNDAPPTPGNELRIAALDVLAQCMTDSVLGG